MFLQLLDLHLRGLGALPEEPFRSRTAALLLDRHQGDHDKVLTGAAAFGVVGVAAVAVVGVAAGIISVSKRQAMRVVAVFLQQHSLFVY